jgi:hypothetical protein
MEKIIHNVETNQISIVDLTVTEIDELQAEKNDRLKLRAEFENARLQAETSKTIEKAALLAKLGITDDEAKLLLS